MTTTTKKAPTTKRRLKGQTKLYSDLFKLTVAKMKVNISWSDVPEYHEVEHCHFFHTVDSSGRVQTTSTKIGSHYHRIEVKPSENPNDPPIVTCVSGPLKKVAERRLGQSVLKEVPLSPVDDHHHDVVYISSDEVILRRMTPEVINMQAREAQKTAPIKGVIF
jgi:hypothetical protein